MDTNINSYLSPQIIEQKDQGQMPLAMQGNGNRASQAKFTVTNNIIVTI
jgi:hypothetical protein